MFIYPLKADESGVTVYAVNMQGHEPASKAKRQYILGELGIFVFFTRYKRKLEFGAALQLLILYFCIKRRTTHIQDQHDHPK